MKTRNLVLSALTGLGLSVVSGAGLMAQTSVTQIDADTLKVVKHQGKPPHKRTTVTRAGNTELFAHYAELVDNEPRPIFASISRGGAPGKSLPRTAQRISSDPQEIAEFARFEETTATESRNDARQWRGAPGKSRHINR